MSDLTQFLTPGEDMLVVPLTSALEDDLVDEDIALDLDCLDYFIATSEDGIPTLFISLPTLSDLVDALMGDDFHKVREHLWGH